MIKFVVLNVLIALGFVWPSFGASEKSSVCVPALSKNPFDYYRSAIPRNRKSNNLDKAELLIIFGLRDRAQGSPSQRTQIQTEEESKLILEITGKESLVGSPIYYDEILNEILLQAFAGLAYKFAAERMSENLNLEDLVQAAMLGLVITLREYNPNSKHMFSTEAYNRMKKEFAEVFSLEESGFDVLGKGEVFVYKEVLGIRDRFLHRQGRAPKLSDIVLEYNSSGKDRSDITEEDVSDILTKAAWRKAAVSLVNQWNERASLAEEKVGNFEVDAVALVPAEETEAFKQVVLKDLRREFGEALMTISVRERFVISNRFGVSVSREKDGSFLAVDSKGEEMTLAEVGKLMAISGARVRQIEAQALRKLRHPSRYGLLKEYWDDSPPPRRTGLWNPQRDMDDDHFRMELRERILEFGGGGLLNWPE